MAIKFQYNKTSLNNLNKQLKVRRNALPTLKNKESALRMEVKNAKAKSEQLDSELEKTLRSYDYVAPLWNEFDGGLISVKDVLLKSVKVAGIKTPAIDDIIFDIKEFDLFNKPMWYSDGVAILKKIATLGIKVNLYEKVQIPGYMEAIRKIKRYMEDEENLSKASQKIVKQRHAMEEEEND